MKKQSFIAGAIILALGGFFAKAIGAFYKVPLTNILGSNGMGIYYLIFPLYSMVLVFSSSGISVALSRLVAVERADRNKYNEKVYFVTALLITFALSLIFSVALWLCARPISVAQGNANAYMGYVSIAPAVLCASLVAVVKGYFQGIENMIPSSVSMIVEQVVKLAVGLVLATRLMTLGVEYAVFGAILGVTVSELVALIIMFVNYAVYKRKSEYKYYAVKHINTNVNRTKYHVKHAHISKCTQYNPPFRSLSDKDKKKLKLYKVYVEPSARKVLTYGIAVRNLLSISLPTMLSNLVVPITSFIDSFVVINMLVGAGKTTAVATSLYGINNGAVSALVSLPIILTSALSTVIVPNLSGIRAEDRDKELSVRCSFFIKLTFVISIPMFVLFIMLAPDIISVLYSKGLSARAVNEFDFAYKLLAMSSVTILYNALLQTFVSILQSIGKAIVPFYAMIAGVIVRTVLLVTLITVPNINIFAVVIANTLFLAITSTICLVYISRRVRLQFGFFRLIVYPIFAGVVSAVVVYLFKQMLFDLLPGWVYVGLSGLMCLLTYVALIYVLKCFNERECKFFPSVRRILRKTKLTK